MGLREQILDDIKSAMKAKESEKLSALRLINSAIKNREIEIRPKALEEGDIQSVLKKMAKQRKDSIEQYENAKRDDLAAKEKAELELIEKYLPEAMGKEQVEALVKEVIAATGADSMKQMGQVMKEVLAKSGGTADGKMVSEIVKNQLS